MRPTGEQIRKWAIAAQEYDLATAFIIENGQLTFVEFVSMADDTDAVERVSPDHLIFCRTDEELEQTMRKVAENCALHGRQSGSFFLDRLLNGKPPHRFWFGQEPSTYEHTDPVIRTSIDSLMPKVWIDEAQKIPEAEIDGILKRLFGKGVQGHE